NKAHRFFGFYNLMYLPGSHKENLLVGQVEGVEINFMETPGFFNNKDRIKIVSVRLVNPPFTPRVNILHSGNTKAYILLLGIYVLIRFNGGHRCGCEDQTAMKDDLKGDCKVSILG